MMSRFHRFSAVLIVATAGLLLAAPSTAQEPRPDSDAIVFALMSGKCPMLKIAGRNYRCRAVAFSQSEQGRANFTIALDDPADDRHVVTFSGDHGVRPQDNLYELPIDQMQLKSRDRPEADGLPVPLIEVSAGNCKLVGSLSTQQVSSIACAAINQNGAKYELRFESDGSPIELRRIRKTHTGTPVMSPFD
jgi:hypothetical protein